MSSKIKQAIVVTVAAVGLAAGTMGAVAAGTVYHHGAKTHAVAGSDVYHHG
jgi:hypothetical protein